MRLRPHRVDLFLYYKCPKCDSEYSMTLPEVKAVGKIFCSTCNKAYTLERIENIKVIPTYVTQPQTTIKKDTNNEMVSGVVSGLVRVGYRKQEAKKIVADVLATGQEYDSQSLFTECFKRKSND